MALFGEKYGDWVRMVEIDGRVARALRRHARGRTPAELGLFHLLSETSSASNVRRIEAVTGRAGAELFRDADRAAARPGHPAARAGAGGGARRGAAQRAREGAPEGAGQAARPRRGRTSSPAGAEEIGGLKVVVEAVPGADAKALLRALGHRAPAARRLRGGARRRPADGRVHLVANFAPAAVERGLSAGEVVRAAAQVVGGGGGGRDTMAQAGGRDPEKLPDALAAARLEIERSARS